MQNRASIPMSFREIERILKAELPHSKTYRAWWSNNANNNVMTRQWLDAGYETESVDIEGEKLVFRRIEEGRRSKSGRTTESADVSSRDPIFGCMKGTLTIPPDLDLTAPADPDWGKVYEDE
jgi:hypothetical protein